MQNVGEHSLAPETIKEAIKLARMAKEIVCPIPGGAGGCVKIVKADYIALLTQWKESNGNQIFADDMHGHQGGVFNTVTKVMSL
jgi:hypothetical protein